MKKRINLKHVSITLLIASNLLLINEVRTIKKDTINKIYMDQVESGSYNESETNVTRNPMNGEIEKTESAAKREIEKMLLHNHEQGNY